MNNGYRDIRERITEPPLWWDERAVPRYCQFTPNESADIYADEVALVEITCQACGRRFKVCFSSSQPQRIFFQQSRIADGIKDGSLHYGDPPNVGCCAAGATMNCDDIRVIEYWYQPQALRDWQRDSSLEIELLSPTPDATPGREREQR